MKFEQPLIRGQLVKRYKRFLADIRLETGEIVVAHCPNPGSMLGINDSGMNVWVSYDDSPKRKLLYTWQLAMIENSMVGINTQLPNKVVYEALENNKIPSLECYNEIKREVPYAKNSRVDFLLKAEGKADCYLEVKNVQLSRKLGLAEFPDSPTKRGLKHLFDLTNVIHNNIGRGVLLFLIQRNDSTSFKIAKDIDPDYKKAFDEARKKGLEVMVFDCEVSIDEVIFGKAITNID